MYESYVFYSSFHEACKDLDRAQYGEIMYVLNEYALSGVVPESFSDPIVKMAFIFMKPQIDANNARKEAGNKGGAPKGNNNATKKQPMVVSEDKKEEEKTTTGCFFDEKKQPNVNVNANVNANANDIAAEAAAPDAEPSQKPKAKKQPLREREPENDLETVEKAYLKKWDELHEAGVLNTPDPPSGMWTECRAHIKQHLKTGITTDQMIHAIEKAAEDSWVLRGGFLLKTILSSGVFNRLVNGYETPPEKVNGTYVLQNDRKMMQDASKVFEQNERNKQKFIAEYAQERQVPNENLIW